LSLKATRKYPSPRDQNIFLKFHRAWRPNALENKDITPPEGV
jgi:hypothetical protein